MLGVVQIGHQRRALFLPEPALMATPATGITGDKRLPSVGSRRVSRRSRLQPYFACRGRALHDGAALYHELHALQASRTMRRPARPRTR